MLVSLLDEEPVLAVTAANQGEGASEFAPKELEFEVAPLQHLLRIAVEPARGAPVPNHHRAAAVLAFGDPALEVEIFQRVVLHVNGQALLSRVQTRPLGDGPRREHAVDLEPEVIVQAAGGMLLDHKADGTGLLPGAGGRTRASRFRGDLEAALALVVAKCAGCLAPSRRPTGPGPAAPGRGH